MILLDQAVKIVETAVEHDSRHFYPESVRNQAIEALWGAEVGVEAIDKVEAILRSGRVISDTDDPCDEVRV